MPRRVLLGLLPLVLLAPPVPSAAAPARRPIQPGAFIQTDTSGCTLNFVFADPRNRLYVGTAGHCVSRIGEVPTDEDGRAVGRVVFGEVRGRMDFALIAVDRARYADVSPAVRVWGGPRGIADVRLTAPGDDAIFYGYGVLYERYEFTRQRRAVLLDHDHERYVVEGPVVFGDSGGPVLHVDTGAALGTVAELSTDPPSALTGPTVDAILRRLAKDGIRLRLLTAAYSAPEV